MYILGSYIDGDVIRKERHIGKDDICLVLTVCTISTFLDEKDNWEYYWGKDGKERMLIIEQLCKAGASEMNIRFFDYLNEKKWEENAKYLVITGGDAELGIERIKKFNLLDKIMRFEECIIAYSAGALLLLNKFCLLPNYYYKEIHYCDGIGKMKEFPYLFAVHYDYSEKMANDIRTVSSYYKIDVLALTNKGFIIYKENDSVIRLSGDVNIYNYKNNTICEGDNGVC